VPVDFNSSQHCDPVAAEIDCAGEGDSANRTWDLGVELSRIRSSVKVSSYPLNFACGLARVPPPFSAARTKAAHATVRAILWEERGSAWARAPEQRIGN
jgi:hypothetical protein